MKAGASSSASARMRKHASVIQHLQKGHETKQGQVPTEQALTFGDAEED
jgi:hypothetical protein